MTHHAIGEAEIGTAVERIGKVMASRPEPSA
jgi:hypothetical protein